MTGNFNDFLTQLNTHVQNKFNMSTTEKIKEYFELDNEQIQLIITQMKNSLNEGSFKFVVLMDSLEDRLKDLIIYMNQNSKFDIYGVELEYYQHDTFEILIPKLYGNEVKKDVSVHKTDNTFISNDEFIKVFSSINLGNQIQEVISILEEMQKHQNLFPNWEARRAQKSISFTYTAPERTKQSLTISITISGGKPNNKFEFWLYDKNIETTVISLAKNILKTPTYSIKSQSSYGVVVKWPLKSFSQDLLTEFCQELDKQVKQ